MDKSTTNTTNNHNTNSNSYTKRWSSLLASLEIFTDDFLS